MAGLVTKLSGWVRRAGRWVFPVLKKARGTSDLAVTLRWMIHLVILVAIVVALYYANNTWLRLSGFIFVRFPFLAKSWLPILFLLVYLLAWLGWWLWTLLTPDADESYD